jgi:hypothetical protein
MLNNNPNASIEDLRVALIQDIRDGIQGNLPLAPLLSSMKEADFKHVGTISDIVNAGGKVSGAINGQTYEMPGGMKLQGGHTLFTGSSRDVGSAPAPAGKGRGTHAPLVETPQKKGGGGTPRISDAGGSGRKQGASLPAGDSSGSSSAPRSSGRVVSGTPQSGAVMPPAPPSFSGQPGRGTADPPAPPQFDDKPAPGPREASGAAAAFREFAGDGTKDGSPAAPQDFVGKLGVNDVNAPEGTKEADARRDREKRDILEKSAAMKQKNDTMNPMTTLAVDVQNETGPILKELAVDPKGSMIKFGNDAAKGRLPDF